MLKVLFNTGVRVSELCSMKHKDIDFENHRAKIIGKGSKTRSVFLGSDITKGLKSYLNKRKKG